MLRIIATPPRVGARVALQLGASRGFFTAGRVGGGSNPSVFVSRGGSGGGRIIQQVISRRFSTKPSNKVKTSRQQSRAEQDQYQRPMSLQLYNGITSRLAAAQTNITVFFIQRVPEMLRDSRIWLVAKLREIMKDPRVLATWTVAGYKMVKEFCHHLWVGSKLLYANTRIATRLLRRAGTGKQLTRGQQKLLVRTSADLLRLIPFSFFVLVPFMELLLPVALKVFPNMIPSTFESTAQREKKYKEQLSVKLGLAQNLRDIMLERVHLVSLEDDEKKSNEAVEFAVFLEKMKRGVHMSKSEITKAATFFRDEFTIDGASRSQLEAMAELMNIGVPTYAPIELLRFQIRRSLRQIQADDREIYWQGVETLDHEDLQEANEQRGMPFEGMTDDQLRKQLNRWLLLSMNNAVPASLLILSRTFVITNDQSRFLDGTAIAAAIKSIPKDVVQDIQEDLMEDEIEKSSKRKPQKTDDEVLEELEAADAKATEESARLDEMVEEDRLRTDKIAAFRVELEDMTAMLAGYDQRLNEMNIVMQEAIEQSKLEASLEDSSDETYRESRLSEKLRLEKAVQEVEEKQTEFKEKLAGIQGDVKKLRRERQNSFHDC